MAAPVGIAVVEHRGCFLVGVRAADDVLAGCAEFPGGKCLPGEPPADCACRECREEAGLSVVAARLLLNRLYEYPHGDVDLSFWLCRPERADDVRDQHRGFVWVPAAELARLTFPPANAPLVAMLLP